MKMKGIFTVFVFTCLMYTMPSLAQNLTPPKDGASIRLVTNKIEVSSKEAFATDVWLVKSKRYAARKFGGLQAKGPQGVKISFEPKDENKDVFSMKINVDKEAPLGKFTVVIKGEGENSQKVKSSVVSITVAEGSIAGANRD